MSDAPRCPECRNTIAKESDHEVWCAVFAMREMGRMRADAKRWQTLVALARANSVREGLGGGLMICSAEPNDHDAAWASIQALDHDNPTKTLWISEGMNLGEAIDKALGASHAV